MDNMFSGLMALIKAPIRHDRGIKTDNSILLVYPPDRELDFREYLLDIFVLRTGRQAHPVPPSGPYWIPVRWSL